MTKPTKNGNHKEIMPVQQDDNSPANIIRMAIAGKPDIDLNKLEKFLELQEKYEANQARKIFTTNFALAQKDITAVLKNKKNPQTHSQYAGLDDIINMAKPVYTDKGFSVIFYEGNTDKPEHVRICADILHSAGHKETYFYDMPLDGSGIKGNANMTKIHGKSSSTSYARRYLLCMIWNIPTQDTDGNTTVANITKEQADGLRAQIKELGAKEEKFLDYMGLEKLEDMPLRDYRKAQAAIEAQRKAKEAKESEEAKKEEVKA